MKKVSCLGVQELSHEELFQIEGGSRGKLIKKALEWIGVFDIVDDFVAGFNSREC